ncbi:polyunsaturated fatty acid lipoxygenase ALOX15B-like [Acanthopagrus latus]|uniref:polyunsaturated fatty acid lipoxygenase ALOX15B-like n=1 Tax=Acanthopagrus latus TaxID=8177 RepID=UPI00187BC95B|nr:polyunsaturated fatty acid lipoxygenase ALOX15B-like [Acanthopagrus latus]
MACFDLNPFDGLTLRSQHSCNQGMSNTCDCCLTAQVMLGSLPMLFRDSKVLLSLQGVSESLYDYVCLMAQYLTGFFLLLKLEKDPFHESPERDWFCSKVVVTTPEEDEILFPCHRWLSRGEFVLLRGGRATKAFEDLHPRLLEQRQKELLQQKLTYVWAEYADGMSYVLNIPNPRAVPAEISYSPSKAFQFESRRQNIRSVLKLKNLTDEPWESFEAMKEFPWFKDSPVLEYVSQHWQDDDFFGYQFLNGANPHSIRRCSALPSNFPVTEEMVKPFLANGSSLTAEMEKGNIFIIDYKIMDGLPTRVVDDKLAARTAPLCLLYLNTEKKLQPIAIQLHQQSSEQNPIFLPSDLKSDWLLAKIFVKHADILHVQLLTHLLNPHLLAETFAMATLRNLPMIHPLHKAVDAPSSFYSPYKHLRPCSSLWPW